jgi:hypothetical protein
MRFYTKVHEAYGGIDLHARTMYVCILNRGGEILLHRNMPTSPETFLDVRLSLDTIAEHVVDTSTGSMKDIEISASLVTFRIIRPASQLSVIQRCGGLRLTYVGVVT